MKKIIRTLFFCVIGLMKMTAQLNSYSTLIVKQSVKGMSFTMSTQITHYLGNEIEKDYTKSNDGVRFNEIIDVLNGLKQAGWTVISVTTHTNLTEDDVKTGVNVKNTTYIHYLLFKEIENSPKNDK
jgi:hypothetical protein